MRRSGSRCAIVWDRPVSNGSKLKEENGEIMLPFREISIEDKKQIEEKLSLEPARMTERCFTDMFIWRCRYRTLFAIQGEFLYMLSLGEDAPCLTYLFPVGKGDRKTALEVIAQDARERGKPYRILGCTQDQKEEVESLLPGRYAFTEDRDNFDYIYRSEDLATLKGKKLHSKRNFINRFLQEHENNWHYEKLDPAKHRDEILKFHHLWCERHDENAADTVIYEHCAVWQALEHYEDLAMRGGVLYVDGRMAAFTMGSPSCSDALTVQIEKAMADIPGAYPLINREFIAHEGMDFPYVNREEDMGIEGLRKAKLSYRPVELTAKYRMEPLP